METEGQSPSHWLTTAIMEMSLLPLCLLSSMWICSEGSGQSVSVLQPPTIKCIKGKFFSQDSRSCVRCRRCDYFSAEVAACNKTSDTVCKQCLKDTGIPNKILKGPTCRSLCRPCGPGKYVKRACKLEKNQKTRCGKCQKGSFSAMTSYAPHCVPCTDCGNMEEISPCTHKEDAVCGKCKPGFYRDSGRNMCFKCHSCLAGQKEIDDCRGGVEGKLCSGFYFRHMIMKPLVLEDEDTPNTTLASTSQTTTTAAENSIPTRDPDEEQRSPLEDTALTTLILTMAVTCSALLIILIAMLGFKLATLKTTRRVTRIVPILEPEGAGNLYTSKPVFTLDNCNEAPNAKVKDTKEKYMELMSARKFFNLTSL
ncbi:unnamed protein product [Lymnaea stagnalis]|uniref:TNFR-Cys domain-containing protein n=1 Tax=Lymnaea stagnalis TaxID=6523 RepID=A0AAV2HX51_LYMST